MLHKMISLFRQKATIDVGYYLGANMFKAGLPFVILPFLTIYLVPEEYGLWSLYLALIAFLTPLMACGLPTIIARNFHKYDPDEHAKMVFAATTTVGFFCLCLLLIFLVIWMFTPTLFNIPLPWLMLAPWICFIGNFQYFNKTILVHENRSRFYSIWEMSSNAIMRVGGLLAVIFVATDWTMLLLATVIVHTLYGFLALYILIIKKRILPSFDFQRIKSLVTMGYPIIGHTLGAFIMTLSDRIILERMTDMATVGIYSIGASLGMGVLIFCNAFSQRWGPWQYRQLKEPTTDKKFRIVRYSYYYFVVTFLLALIAIAAGYVYVITLVDSAYHSAVIYIPWIAGGAALYGMSLAVVNYVTIEGKTKHLPFVTGTAAVINIIATIMLIKINGAIGAAQATFIAYLYYFIMMWWVNNRVYPMPWMKGLRLR
jgi:O-antigen/teichoic acid export membrane protein